MEQMLPQMERTTGANVCCRPQIQCCSCNDGLTQQSKKDWQQVATYLLPAATTLQQPQQGLNTAIEK
jgi:hypothetical protein